MSYRKYLMADDVPPSELYKAVELSTNLAEVGTDCISRQAVKEILDKNQLPYHKYPYVWDAINALPPAQPEIVRCKDCKHHWTHRCMDSMPIERCDLGQTFYDAEVDYCSLAERREVTT